MHIYIYKYIQMCVYIMYIGDSLGNDIDRNIDDHHLQLRASVPQC